MSIAALILSASGNLALAVLSLLKAKRNLLLRGFGLLALGIFSWNMISLGMFYIKDIETLQLWTRIFRIGLYFLPANFLYFALLFSQSYRKNLFNLIIFSYIVSAITSIGNLFFETEFIFRAIRYYPQSNIFYNIFLIQLSLSIIYGLYKVSLKYQKSRLPIRKNQLKYFFFATFIAFIGSSTNILNAFGFNIPGVSSLSALGYSVIMWYAILRHNLMSIEVMLKRSIVYAILIGTVLGGYLIFIFSISAHMNPELNIIITSMAVILSALFFHPLEKYIQKVTDKIFFKETYNYYQTINKLSAAMVEQLDLDKLSDLITKTIFSEIRLKNTALFLKGIDGYSMKSNCNLKKSKNDIKNLKELINYLLTKKRIIVKEEMNGQNFHLNKTDKYENKLIYNVLCDLNASVVIPLIESNELLGFISIGEKLSGDIFSGEDIQLLDSLAHQAVIGLQNARLYQMSQDKVNEMTTVFNVTKMISSNLDLKPLLNQITSTVISVVGADRGLLFLYEESSNELYAVAGAGTDNKSLNDIRLRVDDSVLGNIFQKGVAKIVPQTTRDTEYVRRLGVKSYIVVPMKTKDGQIIGLLTVDNKISQRPVEQINMELLQTLANQTSIAIENSRLYEDATKRVDELSALNKKVINLKDYYEDILESQPSGVITIDNNNIVKTFNSTASKTTGLQEKTVLGNNITTVFQENIEMIEALTQPVENKEITYIDKSGQKHSLNISSTTLRSKDSHQYGMQSVLVDLTEVKLLEAQVRKNDKLSALGTMVAGVAHEIKNPLTSMKLFIQLMEENKHNPGFWDEYGSIISNEVSRLEKIVEDFLGFARTPELNLEKTSINIVLNKVISLVKSQARKENIRLNVNLTEDLAPIKIDSQRIVQVFLNLILNAIQAISNDKKGAVTITSEKVNSDEISVSISDNGCGIPKENLDKLFTPFFTTKEKGTGLGLSIIHKIIEEHLGEITVESTENNGTTFTVTLPVSS